VLDSAFGRQEEAGAQQPAEPAAPKPSWVNQAPTSSLGRGAIMDVPPPLRSQPPEPARFGIFAGRTAAAEEYSSAAAPRGGRARAPGEDTSVRAQNWANRAISSVLGLDVDGEGLDVDGDPPPSPAPPAPPQVEDGTEFQARCRCA